MRLVLQRVTRAHVEVAGERVAAIGRGLLVLVGVAAGDGEREAAQAADKLLHLRVFADPAGKMNLDVRQAAGSVLLLPQFTLVGSTARGRRPSFDGAAPPAPARELVNRLAELLLRAGVGVECGRFGADMEVALVNDGPVTFVLDLPAASR
jgi:D-tyrosyl-tRNA(Tyr) deacylase